jgi:hypothetical protein
MWKRLFVSYFKALPRHVSGRTQNRWSKFQLGNSGLENRRVNRYFTGLYQQKLTICRYSSMEVFQCEKTW